MAHDWWVAGLAFYLLSGLAAMLAAVTERTGAARGITAVESMLLLLLLLEDARPPDEPSPSRSRCRRSATAVAACLRLALRLVVIVVGGRCHPGRGSRHDGGPDRSGSTACARGPARGDPRPFAAYVLWRILKYRMDRYIASTIRCRQRGFQADGDDDAPAAASRLRTVMPVMKVTAGIAILILSSLLVLSQLGVNGMTPLIAARLLGAVVCAGVVRQTNRWCATSFPASSSWPRTCSVSGEYIDGRQGQGHGRGDDGALAADAPPERPASTSCQFGQLTHITNFQPRLDDGEVQPRLRAQHRRRAVAQDRR